jgi:hypothetical protein
MPKGRPKGSKNKPKEVTPEPDTKKRGRPSGSKNIVLPPKAEGTVEPIVGFQNVTHAFGERGYAIYCNIPDMELKPDDMPKAVEGYHARYSVLPQRIIIHERNKHLLPYLYAQIPDVEVGLANAAIWELKLQVPG